MSLERKLLYLILVVLVALVANTAYCFHALSGLKP